MFVLTLGMYLLSETLSVLWYGAKSKSIDVMCVYTDADCAAEHPLLSLCLDYITKRFTEWVGKKRVREEIEATWWRKRRVKRGREQSRQ